MTTSLGVIEVELNAKRAPVTTENFLRYAKEGFYDGTVFHRVIPGFMIQGGGFEPRMTRKQTHDPINNEADNGLKNARGTIAMARPADPHSATSQFFINTVDNENLNHTGKTGAGWGYAVFGKVIKGMDVVTKIENQPTTTVGPYRDVPETDVLIQKIEIVRP
ncbi:MAG: peptidylprolyl isomerase [Acidiferrobacterales bacterium]|nr:peptidylprolyl isomerase [Acidiferrobacterales bacterium]